MYETNQRLRQKPVIFLAFANDRVDYAAYLRNLPQELRGIREALEEARRAGLCEIVERSGAAVEDIINVFQDDAYQNRIAIFHYGGHANGYQLLLESLQGEHAPAHREGLAAFLARQEGLKFIFLNGCSTQQHALELTQAGIPAVVGTSQSINDEVAANLSIRFYKGIANGASLEKAWLDAQDHIKTKKGTANFRDLYWEGKKEIEDRFPWDIFYKKGGEKVKGWNLPEAANDPCQGLPEIPQGKLPEKPFLLLNRYERKHAEIFFGRSYYIRELYERVTDTKSPPIILLYGQSGVGKSSLLDAGLMPRLEKSHIVCSARRDPQKGLLATLEETLKNLPFPGKQGGIAETWQYIETETDKPLVIILDQADEVYTSPNKELKDELEGFLKVLLTIFGNPAAYPRGKLLLGYCKEYHPDIDEKFKNYQLDRMPLFIKPLRREDIIDVVTGLTRTQRLRDKYNIEVEEKLPIIIADDLLEDQNTPVAPILQIILTKMWEISKKDDFSPLREFKVTQYQELRKKMLLLSDFFQQQIEKLRNWNKRVVDSGLALDILNYHTTERGTACARNIRDIQQNYLHSRNIIHELVQKLKDFYLLTDAQQKDETSLAHDTLAPVVIDEYNDSNRPGQRASRILAAKIEEFKNNKKIYLDEVDLEIVEEGKKGMRTLDDDEEQLLEKSRQRKLQREREKKWNKNLQHILVIFIFIFAVFALYQWKTASDRSKRSEANHLAAQAERAVEKNPTAALNLAEEAYLLDKNKFVIETLQKIYRENNFYKIIARQDDSISRPAFSADGKYILTMSAPDAVFSPDGHYILTRSVSEDKNAYLWNLKNQQIKVLKGHDYSIISIAFSPDSKYILTGSKDRAARLWNLEGKMKKEFKGHKGWVYSVAFSPDGKQILTGSRDRTARLWDTRGYQLQVFKGHKSDVLCAVFSPEGKYILTGSVDKTARLWDLAGKMVQEFKEHKGYKGHKDWVNSVAFSADGKQVLTGSRDGTACLWDLAGKQLQDFKGHQGPVNSAVFSPGGNYILSGSTDNTARLWDLKGNPLQDFKGHENSVTTAVFSPDSQFIFTASWDGTIRQWNPKGTKFQELGDLGAAVNCAAYSPDGQYIITGLKNGWVHLWKGNIKQIFQAHETPITSAAFSPNSKYILTGSTDNTARLWDLQGKEVLVLRGHKDRITSVAFSPKGQYILTGSWDNTARLWDAKKGKMVHEFTAHKDDVNCAVFSPDGQTILSGSWDNTAILWNLPGEIIQTFTSPGSLISCIAFSPDGNYILTGSNDGTDVLVRLWDLKGYLLQVLTGHQYRVSSLAFSPDSKYILSGSWDKTARLWDLQGNELQVFKGHEGKVNSVAFSPDRQHLLTASADKTVRIWKIIPPLEDFLQERADGVRSLRRPFGPSSGSLNCSPRLFVICSGRSNNPCPKNKKLTHSNKET